MEDIDPLSVFPLVRELSECCALGNRTYLYPVGIALYTFGPVVESLELLVA